MNLNPWAMRALPALAGTLMAPAIWFLARQIVSPRAAILAAAMTACSGYLLGWSRQAQLQAPFWLLVVLNFATLLYWLRTRKAVSYLAWLASGLVMIGLDLSGITALALEVLVFVTWFPQAPAFPGQPRGGRMRRFFGFSGLLVLFVLGLGIIGFCGLYGQINEPAAAATMPASGSSPVVAARQAPAPASGAELALESYSSALMGWQYPRASQRGGIDPRLMKYLAGGLEALSLLLVLALAPWGRERFTSIRFRGPMEMPDVPKMTPSWRQTPYFERFAQPQWRISFWLLVWLLAPAYLFYQMQSQWSGDPRQWASAFGELIAGHWVYAFAIFAVLAISILYWIRRNHPITRRKIRLDVAPVIQIVMILAALYAGALVIWRIGGLGRIPAGDLISNKLLPSRAGFVWAPFAILVAAMLFRIRFARVRRLGIFLLLAINLAVACLMIVKNPRPRVDLIARDVLAGDAPRSRVRTFVDLPDQSDASIFNDVGNYYLAMESGDRKAAAADRAGKQPSAWKIDRITNERMAVAQANHSPHIDTIIVWDRAENPTATRFGSIESAGWSLMSDEHFPVYDQWTWQRLDTFRRRMFHRESNIRAVR